MFLHVVGHNQRFRVIHQNFRRSIETVSRYFREVLYAVSRYLMVGLCGLDVGLAASS